MRSTVLLLIVLVPATTLGADDPAEAKRKAINAMLDDWHKAASEAKEARYFGHIAEDGVFFGTDMKERWSKEEFRTFAKQFFDKGKGWTFKAMRRNVMLAKDGKTAWFDEVLDTKNLGPARGTGVAVLEGEEWKIAQYHLCVPIPNDVFEKVKKIIEEGR